MDSITLEKAQSKGTQLFEWVESDYQWTGVLVYKIGRKYAYFTDAGCSCVSPWEGNESSPLLTKTEFKRLIEDWRKQDGWTYQAEHEAVRALDAGEWQL